MPEVGVRGQQSLTRTLTRKVDEQPSTSTSKISLPAACCLLLTAAPAWAAPAQQNDEGGGWLLLLLALLSFPALTLVLWALAPGPLNATCQAMIRARGRCLMTGSLAAVVGLVLLSVLGQSKGAGEIVAALVMGLLALGGLTGLTAVTGLLGQEVAQLAGRTGSRALTVLVGAALLVMAALFPIVGQVLLLYFVLVGTGGAIHALARSRRPEK